jgi:hypothetical protein
MLSFTASSPITFRTASGDTDFWLVRQFLLDLWGVSSLGHV